MIASVLSIIHRSHPIASSVRDSGECPRCIKSAEKSLRVSTQGVSLIFFSCSRVILRCSRTSLLEAWSASFARIIACWRFSCSCKESFSLTQSESCQSEFFVFPSRRFWASEILIPNSNAIFAASFCNKRELSFLIFCSKKNCSCLCVSSFFLFFFSLCWCSSCSKDIPMKWKNKFLLSL